MVLVDNIESYCRREGLAIKTFEKKCGLYNMAVKRWEKFDQTPTLRTMEKIVNATGIPIEVWTKKGGI